LDQTRRFFCKNAAALLRKMLRREMLFETRVAANSAVERMKPFVAGGPRRQLLMKV
jgi:hypothetical protein